jgi:hypothetical protein
LPAWTLRLRERGIIAATNLCNNLEFPKIKCNKNNGVIVLPANPFLGTIALALILYQRAAKRAVPVRESGWSAANGKVEALLGAIVGSATILPLRVPLF